MSQVMTDVWAGRKARVMVLAQRYPFAREMLDLCGALLPVQEAAFWEARAAPPAAGRIAAHVAERVVPGVLAATIQAGPAQLAAALSDLPSSGRAQAVVAAWMFGDAQPIAERYLARAALSPVLEAIGEVAGPAFGERSDDRHCPLCGGPPQVSYFAPAAEDLTGGGRRLVCARCHADWSYPRTTCASCGEQTGSRLPIYGEVGAAAGERGSVVRGLGSLAPAQDAVFPHVRIEGCEACKRYLLNIDRTAEAAAVPLVDELAALPLDLYARDQGLTKITPNLMGF